MKNINSLINFISLFPSLGRRSAARIVLKMMENKKSMMYDFSEMLRNVADLTQECKICKNFGEDEICSICSDRTREFDKLCLVDNVSDLWQIEKTESYKGLYHIFKIEDIFLDEVKFDLNLKELKNRIVENDKLEEIIFAFNLDVKTRSILLYIFDILVAFKNENNLSFKITTLAKGIPIGSAVEYMDEGTISAALFDRKEFS